MIVPCPPPEMMDGCGLNRIRGFSFWSIAKISEKVWAGYFLDFYELEYHGTTLTYFWFELVYHKKYYSFKKVQFISNFYKIPLKNHNPNPCAFVPSDLNLNFRTDFTFKTDFENRLTYHKIYIQPCIPCFHYILRRQSKIYKIWDLEIGNKYGVWRRDF